MADDIKITMRPGALRKLEKDVLDNELNDLATSIMKDAVRHVHVDTGALKASAFQKRRGKKIVFGFAKHYAEIEEYRHDHNGFHAYFRPAIYKYW